jgi:hypothetical protein
VSLFKRGNVWWSYFFEDGIRHQSSTGTSNRKQAETIEAKLKEEVTNRRFHIVKADPTMTFGDLAARFLASGSVRPHHIYHLKFLLPFFADTAVLRVTKSLADEFRRQRQSGTFTKDATVNRDLSVLRHILYWGVDEQLLLANPLARLKMARERRIRRQVLSVAEEISLLAAAKGHLRAMIIAALDTGMRRGEITSQRWEDIDFSRKLLFVTRSKTPEGRVPLSRLFLSPSQLWRLWPSSDSQRVLPLLPQKVSVSALWVVQLLGLARIDYGPWPTLLSVPEPSSGVQQRKPCASGWVLPVQRRLVWRGHQLTGCGVRQSWHQCGSFEPRSRQWRR